MQTTFEKGMPDQDGTMLFSYDFGKFGYNYYHVQIIFNVEVILIVIWSVKGKLEVGNCEPITHNKCVQINLDYLN